MVGSRLKTSMARKFRADRRGGVAIEFAIVSIPFFLLIFAILETALVFFMGQLLDTAVSHAARQIRTGQANVQAWNLESFRAAVCDQTLGLFSCPDIYLRVEVFPNFGDIAFSAPLDEEDEFEDDGSFSTSAPSDIVVVTAYYQWPVIVDFFGHSMATLANGRRLMTATSIFQNEPFPG
jgi:Flp pilus assembly protein TadG